MYSYDMYTISRRVPPSPLCLLPSHAALTVLAQSPNLTPSLHPRLLLPECRASPGCRDSKSIAVSAATSASVAACSARYASPRAIDSPSSVSYSSRVISGEPVLSILCASAGDTSSTTPACLPGQRPSDPAEKTRGPPRCFPGIRVTRTVVAVDRGRVVQKGDPVHQPVYVLVWLVAPSPPFCHLVLPALGGVKWCGRRCGEVTRSGGREESTFQRYSQLQHEAG